MTYLKYITQYFHTLFHTIRHTTEEISTHFDTDPVNDGKLVYLSIPESLPKSLKLSICYLILL